MLQAFCLESRLNTSIEKVNNKKNKNKQRATKMQTANYEWMQNRTTVAMATHARCTKSNERTTWAGQQQFQVGK